MNRQKKYNSKVIGNVLDGIDSNLEKRIEYRMRLASRIDDARIKMGWSKKDFAKKLTKQPSEISKWLSGTHNFTSDTLSDIETVLGIHLLNIEEKPIEQSIKFSYIVAQTDAYKPPYQNVIRNPKTVSLYSKSTGIIQLGIIHEQLKLAAEA